MPVTNYTKSELRKMKSQSVSADKVAEKSVTYDKDSPDVTDLIASGAIKPVGRPRKSDRKEMISIRLDAGTLKRLRSMGPGWQSILSRRISDWVH